MEESKELLGAKDGITSINESGRKVVNEYVFVKKLGEGAYAKVKLCKDEDHLYAAKIFRRSILAKRQFVPLPDGEMKVTTGFTDVQREIAIMKKLTHTNVVRLKDVIFDNDTEKLYIVMEYCSKGPVMEWDEEGESYSYTWSDTDITEELLRKIMRNAVCGLEYLHYHNIAHRDIKPENMLITEDWTVKLADFGQSHLFSDREMSGRSLGTYYFYPPECCGSDEGFEVKPTDIWALGITFYLMIYQKFPFNADSDTELFEQIRLFDLRFPEDKPIDPELRELIERMLDKNPQTRIKIFEIIQNPWLNRNCHPCPLTNEEIIEPTEHELNQSITSLHKALIAVIIT